MTDRITHILQTIETMHHDQFTDRELEVVENMEKQYHRKGYLTEPQEEYLEDIYRRAAAR